MKRTILAFGLFASLTGCDSTQEQVPLDVDGTVTIDRRPLPDGKVYLISTDGEPPIVSEVRGGAFTLKARPGKYRVEVRMFRDRPDWPGEPHDKQVNIIPARFSSESKLLAEVKPEGPNNLTFALESR